jgi:lipopolysaccharide biosynthesis glycosyltransferase
LITTDGAKGALNPRVISAVETISDIFSRNVQIVPIDASRFDNFKKPTLSYLGNVTYTHLLIPSVIKSVNYVFLDSDIIVQESLEHLLLYDLGDNLIAGVSNGREKDKTRLRLPSDDTYINSGVLIVNAALWRKEHVFETLLDWYAKNTDAVRLADQDIINAALVGRKAILHEKWNTQLHLMSSEDYDSFDENGFRGVFHFSGRNKPWHSASLPKYKALYEKYARVSPLRMPNVD